jgi:hypothetical protein
MITTTMLTLLLVSQAPSAGPTAESVQVSAPAQIGPSIDAGKLKGEPIQLAWSPDGTKLYLQTAGRDKVGMAINPRNYLMSAADGKPESIDAPPAWAAEYWAWKSGQASPASPTFRIDFKEEYKTMTSVSAPRGGDLAKGGVDTSGTGGTTANDVAMQAQQSQKVHVVVYTLKGETIGEFVGQQALHGYTFGWSPAAQGLMAYGNQAGRLTLMDRQGKRQEIDGTKSVILPAWSSDGSKIAFLQKNGKNKYDLFVVTVK